ncbi:d56daf56-c38b-4352-911c-2be237144fde [Sclerotinia trifoliorum]|uniref:D56daf56-c38b-4352-911c-2be237144fde n=1 Tax=Sclerotinia trifoliorum TaxID=28548 RepID=A0A8H2VPB1_9HELO|nr:d56daf56-c38b-4352-911c-2be237144fde [Sclerotinia trifoliorum]
MHTTTPCYIITTTCCMQYLVAWGERTWARTRAEVTFPLMCKFRQVQTGSYDQDQILPKNLTSPAIDTKARAKLVDRGCAVCLSITRPSPATTTSHRTT